MEHAPQHRSSPRVALLGEITHRDVSRSVGGTGIGLVRLARGLVELGWRVDVITARRERLAGYGERVPEAAYHAELGDGGRLRQILGFVVYLLRRRPGVVVARDSRAIDVALAAKRWLPGWFRLVCALHNQANVRRAETPSAEARRQRRFGEIRRRADALLAVSPGMLEAAGERLGPDFRSMYMIPNPAYRRELAEIAAAQAVPRRVPNEPHLLFVGRLSEQKDPGTLLRAFAQVVNQHGRPAQLTLLGEGPLRPEIAALAESLGVDERIRLEGFVDNPMAYMADADVFVMSSVQEAFGYVLVEALGMGLPVVSTDCPYGPRYILDGGRFGRLVPVGDPESLAVAIVETLDGPGDRNALIARAEAFDARGVAQRYEAMFGRLLDARATP